MTGSAGTEHRPALVNLEIASPNDEGEAPPDDVEQLVALAMDVRGRRCGAMVLNDLKRAAALLSRYLQRPM
jgi:hypothetical protein